MIRQFLWIGQLSAFCFQFSLGFLIGYGLYFLDL